MSLRNRTAGRRGRQNICVWQTWQGYYFRVLSSSSLKINIFWSLTKRLSRLSHRFCRLLPSFVLFTINYDFQHAPRVENIALKQRESTNSSEPAQDKAEDEMIEVSPARAQKGFRRCSSCNYGKIVDYTCRFLFPFSFTLFNVLYWYHYLSDWLQKLENVFSSRNVKVKV